MAENLDLKTIVQHLANGSLGDNLCLICLLPLTEDNFENIFTSICKKDEEYCIADVLREVCQLKILDTDEFNICCDCFQSASVAYKFYLQAKRSLEILNFYTDQLSSNIEDLEISEEDSKRVLWVPLPIYNPETSGFDYSFDGIGSRKIEGDTESTDKGSVEDRDEDVIVIVNNEKTSLYRVENGALQEIEEESDDENVLMIVNEKTRKKRDPMMSISCLHCPVRYRFVSKLRDHEKKMHNADIYYCKICKLITDKKDDYEEHLSTHIGNYQCTDCNAVYRRQVSLIEHMKCHVKSKCEVDSEMMEGINICEVCGVMLSDDSALETHREGHSHRYTCYYCGRMYKGQTSFESHIQKHEKNLKKNNQPQKKQEAKLKPKSTPPKEEDKVENTSSSKRSICGICGKSFVDERSLLWHQRLHNNDRPFSCNLCGRGFVSVNRRNQHVVCAHTRPARRCPLCPALFHLRSMVNTHVKKVHLNRQNKRRHRTTKHTNVFWRTETVPIQELSVSIQNEVMEMQSSQDNEWKDLTNSHSTSSGLPSASHKHYDMSTDLPTDILMQEQDQEYNNSFAFVG